MQGPTHAPLASGPWAAGGLPTEGPVAGGDRQRDTGRGTRAGGTGEGERGREQVSRLWAPEAGRRVCRAGGWPGGRAPARSPPLAATPTLKRPPEAPSGPGTVDSVRPTSLSPGPPVRTASSAQSWGPGGTRQEGTPDPQRRRKSGTEQSLPCPRPSVGAGRMLLRRVAEPAPPPPWPSLAGWIRGHACACPGTAGVHWGPEGSRAGSSGLCRGLVSWKGCPLTRPPAVLGARPGTARRAGPRRAGPTLRARLRGPGPALI